MKFTLVFTTGESADISIGMVFIPCAAWVQGSRTLVVPNRKTPHYELGYLRTLLTLPSIAAVLRPGFQKDIVLIIHPCGHGSQVDLAKLLLDCKAEGFTVQVVDMQTSN
jgi:hypothetical protein